MKKKILLLAVVMSFTMGVAMTAQAGWNQDENGWWYEYETGGYARSGMRNIEGNWYLFDSNGYMMTGWQYYEWNWYYMDGSGMMCKNWQYIGDKWYYFNEEGKMETSWLEVDGKIYYLNDDGTLRTGDFELDGLWYSADPVTGEIQRNKKKADANNLRYNDDGTVERYNPDTKQWEYMPSVDDIAEAQMEAIKKDYMKGKYANNAQFEKDAEEKLARLMSEADIYDFINDTEHEYEEQYGSYDNYIYY